MPPYEAVMPASAIPSLRRGGALMRLRPIKQTSSWLSASDLSSLSLSLSLLVVLSVWRKFYTFAYLPEARARVCVYLSTTPFSLPPPSPVVCVSL